MGCTTSSTTKIFMIMDFVSQNFLEIAVTDSCELVRGALPALFTARTVGMQSCEI
jgi:hypothetical protein